MALLPSKRCALFSAILLLSFTLPWTVLAAAPVLGIDLGTEYIKAALVKPGIPLDIVLTKDSKRKEISAVAFKSRSNAPKAGFFPERLYGSDAVALAARFPNDVYLNLRSLLGQRAQDSKVVAAYRAVHPGLDLTTYDEMETVAFRSKSFTQKEPAFTDEELLAMELQNIRANAEALAGKSSKVEDVVVTAPSYFTADEVRALELACELAGLNLLGVISDGLAVGVNYATSRTFPSVSNGGKPESHLVFDMGAGSTTATVLQFQGRTVKGVGKFNKTIQEVSALGAGYDRELGGDALNAVILEDMLAEFVKSPKAQKKNVEVQHIKAHGRAMAKLWKDAERIRQVLSANTETSASFEDLYDGVDFRYKLARTKFETMASAFSSRVEEPIRQALNAAQLTMANIDSVILHGGATRTPFVQARLEKLVGDAGKIRTNVNADEAAVFGAAFKAAGLSRSFRVKEIHARDATPYSFGVGWQLDNKYRRQKLFVPTSQRDVQKSVPVKMLEDFEFDIYQQVESKGNESGHDNGIIAKVRTRNLTASVAQLVEKVGCAATNITTNFNFRLSPRDGLPEVVHGSVSCTAENLEKKGGVVDDVKGFFGFGGKNEEQKPLGSSSTSTTESSSADSETSSGSTSSPHDSATAASDAKPKPKESQETKPKVKTIQLHFTVSKEGIPDLPAAELQRMKKRLDSFDASDRARRLREESLNTLEAFIYRIRDRLTEESFTAASTNAERAKLEDKLSQAADWLYGEGSEASREDLKARLKGLETLVSPIDIRRSEALKRPKAVELLREALNQTKTLARAVEDQIKSADEIASSAQSTSSTESSTKTSIPELDDLEDTTSSETTTASAQTSAPPIPFRYTAEDVSALTKTYETVLSWLDQKLAEQERLSIADDPAFLSIDIEAKTKELNQAVMGLLEKRAANNTRNKSSSKAKSKSKPTERKGTNDGQPSTSTTEKAKSSSSSTSSSHKSKSTKKAAKKEEIKDEL